MTQRSYRWVELSRGKRALVDAEDFNRVSCFNWYAARGKDACGKPVYYAQRGNYSGIGPKTTSLHRFIMNAPGGVDVDHIDRSRTLDCRKKNLRLATRAQNIYGQRKRVNAVHSQYKGVTFAKGKWQVQIKGGGKHIYLGRYSNERVAARVYNEAALKYFGEFAHLNKLGKVKSK